MIRAISTAGISLAAVLMGTLACSAHDGFGPTSTARCGCSANSGYFGGYGSSRMPPPFNGCSSGTCGDRGYSSQFDSVPLGGQGSFAFPGGSPRSFDPALVGPYHNSRQPAGDGLNQQPFVPRTPTPTFGPGAERPSTPSAGRSPAIPAGMEGIAELPPAEQVAALRQRTCPVTQEPLGSMGKPIRVTVAGQSIFVCCEGCVSAVQRNPQKYLQQGAFRAHPVMLR